MRTEITRLIGEKKTLHDWEMLKKRRRKTVRKLPQKSRKWKEIELDSSDPNCKS
jgi:hypothetical protein